MLEQDVVHLPEPSLQPRGFGGLGGRQRVRVRLGEREVAEDEAQSVAERCLDRLHRVVGLSAERAFEIAVLEQLDGRIRVALYVIVGSDRRLQGHDFFPFMVSSASRIPSAPGLMPIGDT